MLQALQQPVRLAKGFVPDTASMKEPVRRQLADLESKVGPGRTLPRGPCVTRVSWAPVGWAWCEQAWDCGLQ
jgi:hypothetical protein